MEVYLNGQTFQLKAGTTVIRSPMIEWPDNIRLDGQQLRKDRRYISTWSINDVSGGLGKKEDSDGSGHRLWDVENVDTRYSNQKILSPALQTIGTVLSIGDIVEWQNNIYIGGASLRYYSPPGSANYISGLTDWGGSGGAMGVARNNLITADHAYDQLGTTPGLFLNVWEWSSVGAPTISKTLLYGPSMPVRLLRPPVIKDMAGTIHVLAYGYGNYPSTNTAYHFIIINGAGASYALATYSDSVGTLLSPLITDGVHVYAALPHAIWESKPFPQIVADMSRSIDANPNQIVYDNYLHFKNRYSVVKYDGERLSNIGFNREDGLRSDKMGEITAFTSSLDFMFAAVKGATYSHILTWNGTAWQYYTRWPTAGIWIKQMLLSNAPDGIDRLWCLPGNDNFPGFFYNPMTNPLLAATYAYVTTGWYYPPIFAGGMSEINGGWYRTIVCGDTDSGSLGVSGNHILGWYEFEGALPVKNFFGSNGSSFAYGKTINWFFGSNAKTNFGGAEGYKMQPVIQLYGMSGATGTSPVINEILVQYLKDPSKRYLYDLTIDIDKTAETLTNPKEAVIGSLNYTVDQKILVPFWYGQMGTRYVKVLESPADEDVDKRIYSEERTGFVRLKLAEII